MRLISICSILPSSPTSPEGIPGSTSSAIRRFFSDALFSSMVPQVLASSEIEYSFSSRSKFPASIFEKSRTSLTKLRSKCPAFSTSLEYPSITMSWDSLEIISFIPRMVLMGVLISCDMEDKKSLFAFDASRARFSAAARRSFFSSIEAMYSLSLVMS